MSIFEDNDWITFCSVSANWLVIIDWYYQVKWRSGCETPNKLMKLFHKTWAEQLNKLNNCAKPFLHTIYCCTEFKATVDIRKGFILLVFHEWGSLALFVLAESSLFFRMLYDLLLHVEAFASANGVHVLQSLIGRVCFFSKV